MLHGCCDCVLNTPALLLRLSGDILKRRPPCSHSVASLKLLNFLKTLTRHSILLNRKSIFKKRLILQDSETRKKFNDENDMNWQFLIFIAGKKSRFSLQKIKNLKSWEKVVCLQFFKKTWKDSGAKKCWLTESKLRVVLGLSIDKLTSYSVLRNFAQLLFLFSQL